MSTAIGVAPSFVTGGLPFGLIGTGFKKGFIAEDSKFSTRFLVGLAAMVLGAGVGLITYSIATPGQPSKADLQKARADIAEKRYNG